MPDTAPQSLDKFFGSKDCQAKDCLVQPQTQGAALHGVSDTYQQAGSRRRVGSNLSSTLLLLP